MTSLRDKHKYKRVQWSGGPSCICLPHEVPDIVEGEEAEWHATDVWMTDAEYEALPEFEAGLSHKPTEKQP